MPGAVTHFEIYAEEPAVLAEFYGELFGWRLERGPRPDYWRIDTGAGTPHAFVGGLTYRPCRRRSQLGPLCPCGVA